MRGKIFAAFAGAIITSLVGVAIYIAWAQDITIADVRRNIRQSLGLPKSWIRDFNVVTAGYRRVMCPGRNAYVVVTGGQSNAANAYDPAPRTASETNGVMYWGGHCYALVSPVLGTTGDRDSLWPALGAEIYHRTGRVPLFISGAVGGVQLGDWLDDRSGYFARLTEQVRGARRHGYRPDLVIWIQGETDSSTMIDPRIYVQQQDELIRRFAESGATRPDTPWLINLSTRCLHRRNNGPSIDKALIAYTAASNDRLFLGPNMSSYDDSFRRDGCHLNTRGRDRLVADTVALLTAYNLMPKAVSATPR